MAQRIKTSAECVRAQIAQLCARHALHERPLLDGALAN